MRYAWHLKERGAGARAKLESEAHASDTLIFKKRKQIVYKTRKHMPGKINLELSGYWPAPGILKLNFKCSEEEKERDRNKKRERERRRKRKRGETWEQRPD